MKFIADRMLGRLTKSLRIYGFDTLYSNKIQFKDVLRIGREEGRIILTRNSQIKKMEGEYRYLFIEDNDPKAQLDEVITGLNLKILLESAFTRCLVCNCELEKIERTDIEGRVPDHIFETHRDFSFCAICKRIFWKGTHHEKMLELLQERRLP